MLQNDYLVAKIGVDLAENELVGGASVSCFLQAAAAGGAWEAEAAAGAALLTLPAALGDPAWRPLRWLAAAALLTAHIGVESVQYGFYTYM